MVRAWSHGRGPRALGSGCPERPSPGLPKAARVPLARLEQHRLTADLWPRLGDCSAQWAVRVVITLTTSWPLGGRLSHGGALGRQPLLRKTPCQRAQHLWPECPGSGRCKRHASPTFLCSHTEAVLWVQVQTMSSLGSYARLPVCLSCGSGPPRGLRQAKGGV